MIKLQNGDASELIKEYGDNTFDAIITDPPYEIGFSDHSWDSTGIAYSVELWQEALRVLKPGGHLISFGAPRTIHRVTCAIEDAGFEIRDQFNWLYTSGMHKHQNIAKHIDYSQTYGTDSFEKKQQFVRWVQGHNVTGKQMVDIIGSSGASHYKNYGQPLVPSLQNWEQIKHLFSNPPKEIMDIIEHFNKPINAKESIGTSIYGDYYQREKYDYIPVTDLGKEYDGFRASLKPNFEPAVVARKPIIANKTLADNISLHGLGAVNIEDNRVNGRMPGNVLADDDYFDNKAPGFILQSKASQSERVKGSDGKSHPTVKPLRLMEHLVNMYTPRNGGLVLDLFAGSGSTLVACENLNKDAVGFEMSKEYCEIINKRINQ